MSDGAEFLAPSINKLRATTLGDVGNALMGRGPMSPLQREFGTSARNLANAIPGVGPRAAVNVGRFAGRAMPLLSVLSNVSDVADIVAGDESLPNRITDFLAGTGGAVAGFVVGGPLGASVGFSAGKALSDGAQWLFGDKKTPEQRKMELALRQLQGGGMYS